MVYQHYSYCCKSLFALTRLRTKCLKSRIERWKLGEITQLLHECWTIQDQLIRQKQRENGSQESSAKSFSSLVTNGKLHSALRQLEEGDGGGVLNLDEKIDGKTVRDILKEKHPPAQRASHSSIISEEPPEQPRPVLFESLTREVVRCAALNTHVRHGAAGPSGVDSDNWRRMCTSFGDASNALCDAVDPSSLVAYVSWRLIPLDKKPGVWPIGIGEVLRRIVGKAILRILRDDITEAVGSLQLCAGHDGGVEAAIHAMTSIFKDDECEGVLLADAPNAFNTLNRDACLQNVQHLCPAMAPIIINTYRHPAYLFVWGRMYSLQWRYNTRRPDGKAHVCRWNDPTSAAIDCHGWYHADLVRRWLQELGANWKTCNYGGIAWRRLDPCMGIMLVRQNLFCWWSKNTRSWRSKYLQWPTWR